MALLKTSDGGRLLSDLHPRTIGPENCSIRRNIRREDDAETLMPGWEAYADLPGDCVYLFRAVRPNGERAVLAFTESSIYRIERGSAILLKGGFQPSKKWDAVNLDGYVVVNNGIDLPYIWDWEGEPEPIYEMREQGIVRAGVMWTAYNFLFFGDITDFTQETLEKWMNGPNPYGVVTDDVETTRTPFRVAWSNHPKEWGLLVSAYVRGNGSKEVVLPFPCESLKPGDKLNFIETVEDGDEVTEQFTELAIESINRNKLQMESPLNSSARGLLNRANYSERILGFDDMQGDGSMILKGGMVGDYIFIARETGVILGQITDSTEAPFLFQESYRGLSAPVASRLIEPMDSSSVFYYSRKSWYEFALQNQRPEKVEIFDLNESLMKGLSEEGSFIVEHSPQRELWIFLKDRTIVFDYGNGLLSEVDAVFDAAALVDDPSDSFEGVDRMMLLAQGGRVLRMRDSLFLREGSPYLGILQYGWMGDTGKMRDTFLRRYIPQGNGVIDLQLDKVISGEEEPVPFFPLNELGCGIAMQMHLRANWIVETIQIKDGSTRLTGREIERQTAQNRVLGYGHGNT